MAGTTLLAGDMGGTKTLLALYGLNNGRLTTLHQEIQVQRMELEPMLQAFISQRPAEIPAPEHGCIAVAGPVRNRTAKITNLPGN